MKSFLNRISLLVLTMLLTLLLSACGAGGAGAEPARPISTVTINGIEKQVIKLTAIDEMNTWLPELIADFNKGNEDYHVEVTYYYNSSKFLISHGTNYEFDFDGFFQAFYDAEARLNIEMTTGSIPDIVIVPNGMATNHYITKGLFTDLNAYIDNDPDFDRSDYLPSLFEAFDRNGKMYEIAPLFTIHAIQAKTADVGSEMFWTLDEFASFVESKPDAKYIIGEMTKQSFILQMVQCLFFNSATGEIKFDRDEFKKILAIAERFPDEIPPNYPANVEEFYQGARNGDPLMLSYFGSSFTDAKYFAAMSFGEETTIKGWPSPGNDGIRFNPADCISIAGPAENPAGAWVFLKYILNNAKSSLGNYMPVNLSLLDEMTEAEIKKWRDIAPGRSGGANGKTAEVFSQADIDQGMTLVKAARGLERGDSVIGEIVLEEIGGYLSGQKSVDTITDAIENRIALYLAEQY